MSPWATAATASLSDWSPRKSFATSASEKRTATSACSASGGDGCRAGSGASPRDACIFILSRRPSPSLQPRLHLQFDLMVAAVIHQRDIAHRLGNAIHNEPLG